jgi:hypothetical protein
MPSMRYEAKRETCALRAVILGVNRSVSLAALVLAAVMGCGPLEEGLPQQENALERSAQSLAGSNGLALNGLVINGLVINGLVINGLVINGLGPTGLNSPDFVNWFNQDAVVGDMVMKYIVYCAANWGQQRSFVNPSTGITYTWDGWLGLAHHWSDGASATLVEQQLISACLAAHVNTYGMHIQLSLLGDKASGKPLYIAKGELTEYSTREACFFGNLFNGEGLYVANDRNSLPPEKSTPRRCGLSRTLIGTDPACGPITRVGSCEQLSCTLDRESNFYRTCTYNGIQYKPLTTRLHPSDVYTCGDGVCQVSERCGTGQTAEDCGLDCGPCS